MSRPIKKGLDYFPLDVDFFEDDKIKFLSVECGESGICVLLKLLCNIYRNGYFCEWNDDRCDLFAWEMRGMCSKDKIAIIIDVCLKRGLFDKTLYEKHKILTSHGIQSRFMAALDGKRVIEVIAEYWLLEKQCNKMKVTSIITQKNNINGEETSVNGEETSVNGEESTQRKEEKSKKKKTDKPFVPPSLSAIEKYFDDNGYTREVAQKAFKYYDAGNWIDAKGNQIKNWKQKMISVWFKNENLKQSSHEKTNIDF